MRGTPYEDITYSNQCKIYTFKSGSVFAAGMCRRIQRKCISGRVHDKQSKRLHT